MSLIASHDQKKILYDVSLTKTREKEQFSPATGSPITTLLRLDPSYQPQINKREFKTTKLSFIIFNLTNFQRVTGGVYKTRVHSHHSMLIHDY